MFKYYLSVLALAVVAAGCSGVKAHTYVMTKERVDIEANPEGNAGYLKGGAYQEPQKRTRKVYVLEMTKVLPEGDVEKKVIEESSEQSQATVRVVRRMSTPESRPMAPERGIVMPLIEDEPSSLMPIPEAEPVLQEAVMYTVEQNDTLQKISKKFYGSYGKWMTIYDANKDKIKNPNFVKPGTVLTIPASQDQKN